MESEKTAKWQYTRHCEDLSVEIKKLREEVTLAKRKPLSMNNELLHLAVHAEEGVAAPAPAPVSGIQQVRGTVNKLRHSANSLLSSSR